MNTDHPIPLLSESELDRARAYIYLLETQAAERRREDKTGKGCIWTALILAIGLMFAIPAAIALAVAWFAGAL